MTPVQKNSTIEIPENVRSISVEAFGKGGNGTTSVPYQGNCLIYDTTMGCIHYKTINEASFPGGGGSGAYARIEVYKNVSQHKLLRIIFTFDTDLSIRMEYDTGINYTFIIGSGKDAAPSDDLSSVYYGKGGLGGIFAIQNPNNLKISDFCSLFSTDGVKGGDQSKVGLSNGYTVSGSGSMSTSPNTNVPYPCGTPPILDFGYVINQGGGVQNTPQGWGSGGTSTPANYKNMASAYRTGGISTAFYYFNT